MEVVSILLFVILFISILYSSYGLLQIILNDVEGSSFKLLAITLIPIIGPIYFFYLGKKQLIIEDEVDLSGKEEISGKQHYRNVVESLNLFSKVLIIVAFSLFILGILLRWFELYFFWESKWMGFFLLFISATLFLLKDIQVRKEYSIQNIASKIVLGLVCFGLLVMIPLYIFILNSEAYDVLVKHVKSNKAIIEQTGEIKQCVLIPGGSYQSSSGSYGTYKSATITILIKGEKRYVEDVFNLETDEEGVWQIY